METTTNTTETTQEIIEDTSNQDSQVQETTRCCQGCLEDQPNQLAHMGPYGCLGGDEYY